MWDHAGPKGTMRDHSGPGDENFALRVFGMQTMVHYAVHLIQGQGSAATGPFNVPQRRRLWSIHSDRSRCEIYEIRPPRGPLGRRPCTDLTSEDCARARAGPRPPSALWALCVTI